MLLLGLAVLSGAIGWTIAFRIFRGGRTNWMQDPSGVERATQLRAAMEKLQPLHAPLPIPAPGDWLAEHHEPGQTFDQYLQSDPIRPDDQRRVIYIQPLGEFNDTQRRIVDLTADYMARFFNAPVTTQPDLSLSIIPPDARRTHPSWGMKQILTGHVLQHVLRPRLPEDATVYLAFTTSDLWPGQGWNFVYGQASLRQRVGVWSIYRNGDPDAGEGAYLLCLRRTLGTAVHETGHMFGMLHCTTHMCVMAGSNHMAESDSHPLWLCPKCQAKVCWAMRVDPVARYRRLAEFCQANNLQAERAFFEKSIAALRGSGASPPGAQASAPS